MKSTERPFRVGIAIGVVLALGPLWGFLVTAWGVFRSFGALQGDGLSDQQALANGVGLALRGTAIGLVLCPVGVAVLALSLVLRARARQQSPPPLPADFPS